MGINLTALCEQVRFRSYVYLLLALILTACAVTLANAEEPLPDIKNDSSPALDSLRADHLLIGVSNFEETLNWYKEKLGFEEEVRWKVESLPDLDLAYLKKNNFRIEIIGTSQPRPGSEKPADFGGHLRTQGLNHLCFEVDDVDAALTELNNLGVPTFIEAATYPLGPFQRRVAFVLDNNGNIIEFAGPLTKLQKGE